jgi:hypothetical protein
MKLRLTLATAALSAAALLGLTACQQGVNSGASASADSGITTLSPEQTALTLMGYSEDDVVGDAPAGDGSPAPSASAATGGQGGNGHRRYRRPAVRRMLGRNVEHGEVVIDTKNGPKTVDVQRGVVTAITDTQITVKSADGFTLTWTFGTPFHVIERRSTVQAKDIAVGAKVGVAGVKQGDTVTANLIVVPNA